MTDRTDNLTISTERSRPAAGVVDVNALLTTVDGDAELLRQLLEAAQETVLAELAALNRCLASDPHGEIAGHAHKLRGTFGYLAARRAGALCEAVRRAIPGAELREAVAALEREAGRVLEALPEILAQVEAAQATAHEEPQPKQVASIP